VNSFKQNDNSVVAFFRSYFTVSWLTVKTHTACIRFDITVIIIIIICRR